MPFIKRPSGCNDPEHNFPFHEAREPGEYIWKCPKCGKESSFTMPNAYKNPYMQQFPAIGNDCMHDNCSGCKNGTCSGVHSISCPCKRCTVTC